MYKLGAISASLLLFCGAAHAATISIQTFSQADYAAQTGGTSVVEHFEDFSTLTGGFENGDAFASPNEGTLSGGLETSVGRFAALGGTGNGTTCQDNDANNSCGHLALENSIINGQGNIAPQGGQYSLSSNDTMGISWDIALENGLSFTRAVFALRDAADVNDRILTIVVGGVTRTLTNLENDNVQLVTVDFGRRMTSANIRLQTGINDGFTFDGAAIAVAAVPLPASVLLMLGGLGALGAASGRRARRKNA